MVDKIQVRIDAVSILPRSLTPFIHEDINIGAVWNKSQVRDGVWCDPYSGLMMITPLQYLASPELNTDIVRHPKAHWVVESTGVAIGSHWDERTYEQEKWLISDGTAEEIETTTIFPKNSGFHVQFAVCGARNETFDAVDMWFGQWRLRIQSGGNVFLYRNNESVETEAVRGSISGSINQNITNELIDLLIMPTSRGDIYIRRNGVAGFWYRMPANQITDGNVIDAGSFKIKPLTGKITFQVTQLRWPTATTGYHYVTPNAQFGKTPVSTQTIAVTIDDDIPSSGGYVASLYKPLGIGEGYADLVPFVYDGTANQYCVGISMVGSTDHNSSPMLFGMSLNSDPGEGGAVTDPSDITYDVQTLSMHTGDRCSDTSLQLTIRNPANHLLDGACNRLCTVTAGTMTIFTGVMKEAAKYAKPNSGLGLYTLEISSLSKYLQEPCLYGNFVFDGKSHTDSVKQLCYAAQLLDADIEVDTDASTLPNPKPSGDGTGDTNQFATQYGDTPYDWIEKIADQKGWQFVDGYLTTGSFGFKYIDPYSLDDTVILATFVMDSIDLTGDYQKVYEWSSSPLEPEGNELVICGIDALGQRIAGRYLDAKSQDETLPVEERPENWLGTVRMITFDFDDRQVVDKEWLQEMALRGGSMLCNRRDIINFHGDYPVGLWKNDVIQVYDSAMVKQPGICQTTGISLYRILGISNIKFENEFADIPKRTADYECIRIKDVI